jgi:glutathione S-transferase
MTIRIHSFPLSGHSHRVELLANLAEIPHEVVFVDLAAGEHKQAPFLKLNPFGEVPALEDGDVVISDSNAILIYLARKFAPAFLPTDPVLEAEVQKFLSLAAGELAFGAAAARIGAVFKMPYDVEFTTALANKYFGKLDAHLEGRDFLVGDSISIADIAIYSYTAHAPEGSNSLEPYPNLCRLLATVESQKGFVGMPKSKVGLFA